MISIRRRTRSRPTGCSGVVSIVDRVRRSDASVPGPRAASLTQAHGSSWHEALPKSGSGVRQILQGDRWRSPAVSAPGQVQTGQMRQKIVLNLEFADLAMKLINFGLMVDLFLLPLAKEVRGVLNQFLLPASDLGWVYLILACNLCQGL